jgi:hypothetical protein
MNRLQREAHHTNAAPRNALQFLMTFAATAAAQWQKRIAEIRHVFPRKRSRPDRDLKQMLRAG